MEVEKRSSKGGFLNLFDWKNGKSRRKLFSENYDKQEGAKGKGNAEVLTTGKLQTNLVKEHASSSYSGKSNGSNSSSMTTNDEVWDKKGPGVVARLMGLDSLPISTASGSGSDPVPNFPLTKVQTLKIDRFQTETLPTLKSAKPIPPTRHKLLSPIKSPRFVPPKNATQVMEAAAKMIESSPRGVHRGRVVSNTSTSVPLRIRELKLRLESANESSTRPQQPKKPNTGNGRSNLGKKTRSGLVSEQRREGRDQISSKDSAKEKQGSSSNRQQGGCQRKMSPNRTINALRQNNQKQNSSASRKFDSISKPSSASERSMQLQNNSVLKIVNKVAVKANSSKKSVRTNTVCDVASLNIKNLTHRKGVGNGDTLISTKLLSGYDKRYDFGTGQGMDVISFTFTSPLKRCSTEENSLCRRMTSSDEFCSVNGDSSLSMLLERKLRELKDKVESYNSNIARTDSLFTPTSSSLKDEDDSFSTSSCSMEASVSTVNLINTLEDREESSQLGLVVDDDEMSSISNFFDCSSVASARQKCQEEAKVVEEAAVEDEFSSSDHPGNELDFLKAAFFEEDGSRDVKDFARVHAPEAFDLHPTISTSISRSIDNATTSWELEYVRTVLDRAELTLDHCIPDPPQELVNPSLYDELESREIIRVITEHEDCSKLQRKVLFDRTNEWLELRYRELLTGSLTTWARWDALVRRNRWVAEEVYRDIAGRVCIGDMMVDVVVDNDMSHPNGKWTDFIYEMFEEGAEIGNGILLSLVDEFVADLGM